MFEDFAYGLIRLNLMFSINKMLSFAIPLSNVHTVPALY